MAPPPFRSRHTLLRRRRPPAAARPMAPPRRSGRPLLRRRSCHAARLLGVQPSGRQREHRSSAPAMSREAHAGRRCGAPFRGCPASRLATRRGALLLSRSAHRTPLQFLPPATDPPPAAGRRGWRPGAGELGPRVPWAPPHVARRRTGAAVGAVQVAQPARRDWVPDWQRGVRSCRLSSRPCEFCRFWRFVNRELMCLACPTHA